MVKMPWTKWPPKEETMTRTRMLEILREHQLNYEEEYREAQAKYDADLASWRATVGDKMLAKIPEMEARNLSWNPSDFSPPFPPWFPYSERIPAAIWVLEHLTVEEIPPAVRDALAKTLDMPRMADP